MNSKIKISLLSLLSVISVLFITNNVYAADPAGSGTAGRQGIGLNVCKGSAEDYDALRSWLIGVPGDSTKPAHPEPTDPVAHKAWQVQYEAFLAAHPGICQPSDLLRLIAKITNILIAISGAFVLFRFIWGGFAMMLFPGNESAATEAKRVMGNALIGIVLIYAAYLVVGTMFSPVLWNVQANFPFPFNYLIQ